MTTTESSSRPRPRVSFDLDSRELAATYDRVSVRQYNHGKVLIEALAPQPGESVLDVGCGTGRLGAYVAGLVAPNGEVVGVDPLALRVELASRKSERFKVAVGRAEDLSAFGDSSFDVAYGNSVLHWVLDKATALREAHRVLKPGGRIGVNSADGDRPHQSAGLLRDALLEEGLDDVAAASGSGSNFRVTGAELGTLLRQAGFEDVRLTSHTFVDELSGVDDLIVWSTSSSFGNFLSELDDGQRARIRERLGRKLESFRTYNGVRLERYLVFATARRPRAPRSGLDRG